MCERSRYDVENVLNWPNLSLQQLSAKIVDTDKSRCVSVAKDMLPSSYNSITRKTSNPIKKWAENVNRHFSKEEIQIAKRHMKRCSILFIIRENAIHTTMKCHLTLIRMAIMKKSTNSKFWRGCG